MVQIARMWYDARLPVFDLILPNMYPDIVGRAAKTARRNRWKEDDWGSFFVDFWRVVWANYASEESHNTGHTLWDVGHSQLIVAAVLLGLQSAFLGNLNQQDEEFFQVTGSDPVQAMRTKLIKRSEKFVEWFPPKFFSTEWKTKSLNTGAGKRDLEEAFRQLVVNKGSYVDARSALVSGSSSSS